MKKDYIAPSTLVIKTMVEHLMHNGSVIKNNKNTGIGNSVASLGSDDESGGEEGESGFVWGDAKNNAWSNWDE